MIPLFSKEQSQYFGCESITSASVIEREHREIRIGIVLEGGIELVLNGHILPLQKGDTYILPAPSSIGSEPMFCTYTRVSEQCDRGFFSVLEAFPPRI